MSSFNFSRACMGLKCVFWGVVTYLVAAVIEVVFGGHSTITLIVGSLAIAAVTLIVFGQASCLRVPPSMPGVGFIYGAVGCSITSVALIASLFFWDPAATLGNARARMGMALGAFAIFQTGDILFNFFLKCLAHYVRDRANERRARVLIVVKFVSWGLLLAAVGLVLTPGGAFLSVIILTLVAFAWVPILFQYMGLLTGLSYSLAGTNRRSFVPAGEGAPPEDDDNTDESDNPFEGFGH